MRACSRWSTPCARCRYDKRGLCTRSLLPHGRDRDPIRGDAIVHETSAAIGAKTGTRDADTTAIQRTLLLARDRAQRRNHRRSALPPRRPSGCGHSDGGRDRRRAVCAEQPHHRDTSAHAGSTSTADTTPPRRSSSNTNPSCPSPCLRPCRHRPRPPLLVLAPVLLPPGQPAPPRLHCASVHSKRVLIR